ncbi:RCC1 domain-containing protein 1 [Lampris incognitus]|uniref:RCC1 domain-containing protein 1 n=1 Tax=Lampris incognitus TaxID=2546036 RepID=UPI0024B599D3|nr:RCC1 domain-containing protein 1 [Lampris incognitus]
MNWFGFGFNAFGQIRATKAISRGESCTVEDVKVITPTSVDSRVDKAEEITSFESASIASKCSVRSSWSRRAALHLQGDSHVWLSGFGAQLRTGCCGSYMKESRGCKDALIGERYLTLSFPDRIECWDLEQNEKTLVWSMESKTSPTESGSSLTLPLVPGGYIAAKPPFYHPLSPQLKAVSLALGAEHAILLSATGVVYSWGLGSHGQLGHESLTSEEEPRAVEALWGMPMSSVATGGWHSACVSAGGDLYIWGWNESGQLGLPSQALRKLQQKRSQEPATVCPDARSSTCQEEEKPTEVFISIQAFPALLDITESCEISKVSCGSRHTAAVTTTGDLYTWGWGEYGQLGHKTLMSSDEPRPVDFFRDHGLHVVDVVCGEWTTFSAVAKDELIHS